MKGHTLSVLFVFTELILHSQLDMRELKCDLQRHEYPALMQMYKAELGFALK